MACFLVSGAEAVVVTAAEKVLVKKTAGEGVQAPALPFVHKLKWLSNMLWGGSLLLAFEHVWHGEVTPFFPFLTAMSDPAGAAEMLAEMASTGVLMAALITAVWAGMVVVTNAMEKKALADPTAAQ